jgi:hypothetical protein
MNCGTVATVPSKTQMTKKLVLTYMSVPQIVGRKLPRRTSSIRCTAIAFEQQPRNTDGPITPYA